MPCHRHQRRRCGVFGQKIRDDSTVLYVFSPSNIMWFSLQSLYRWPLVLVSLWAATACSPTYNWRSVQLEGLRVSALWPCKPTRAERPVPLEGQTLQLKMLSCDAGGHTFAWGAMQLPAGVDSAALAQGWQQASLSSLKAKAEQARVWRPAIRGDLKASGWQASGVRHDGEAITAHAVVLHVRNELHQLVIYGQPSAALVNTWVEGIEAK